MIFGSIKLYWSKIKWGIIISLLIALITIGYLYRSEIQRRIELAQELAQNLATIDELETHIEDMEIERERLLQIMYERNIKISNVDESEDEQIQYFRELKNEDKEYKNWANTRLPDAVINKLQSVQGTGNDNGN